MSITSLQKGWGVGCLHFTIVMCINARLLSMRMTVIFTYSSDFTESLIDSFFPQIWDMTQVVGCSIATGFSPRWLTPAPDRPPNSVLCTTDRCLCPWDLCCNDNSSVSSFWLLFSVWLLLFSHVSLDVWMKIRVCCVSGCLLVLVTLRLIWCQFCTREVKSQMCLRSNFQCVPVQWSSKHKVLACVRAWKEQCWCFVLTYVRLLSGFFDKVGHTSLAL